MKQHTLLAIGLVFIAKFCLAQDQTLHNKDSHKGRIYLYWGWNKDHFTKSDIKFRGNDYDFTLDKVVAKDRQSEFNFENYFNPAKLSIPQYNFRIGYKMKNNWDVSLGMDHMKYVVQQGQTVKISGHIDQSGTVYDDDYTKEDILIKRGFLLLEHTDGLNYVNTELRKSLRVMDLDKIDINVLGGLGAGVMIPKTDATLLNRKRHDKFHLAGYGISSVVGLNVTFFDLLFVQTELKGGFINMPSVRTTEFKSDKAKQHFFFMQSNIVFGGIIRLSH